MVNDKIVAFLLSEDVSTPANIKIVSDKDKSVKIKADLQDCAEWNRNTRQYPKNVLSAGLTRENISELIRKKSWFGEAGHPINPTPQRQMTVVQENISHRVLDYNFKGSIIEGTVKTAPFPMGYAMRDCILDDDPMESAFSLRAMGPVKQTTAGKMVQDPLTIICYDWVFYPSHRNAYQTKIINEASALGNNIITESGICIPLYENAAIQYVKDQSANYKIISELMESYGLNAELSDDNKMIILTEATNTGTDRICIKVEDYISKEITHYMGNFR